MPLPVRLPPGDADREHGRAGRCAVDAARPARSDQQAGELRPVPLDLERALRVRLRVGRVLAADDVDPGLDPASEIGLEAVDAGVEERDRDAVPVEAGQHDSGAGRGVTAGECGRRDRGRKRRPHGIDPGDLGVVLEQGDGTRVERRREPVEDADVAVVGPHAEAVPRELGQDLLLRRVGLRRPAPLVLLGRELRAREPLRDRRRPEDDDHPLAERDRPDARPRRARAR